MSGTSVSIFRKENLSDVETGFQITIAECQFAAPKANQWRAGFLNDSNMVRRLRESHSRRSTSVSEVELVLPVGNRTDTSSQGVQEVDN